MKELSILKVAGKSSVQSVAASIVKVYEEGKDVELHAIGASAVNQAAKAIATARGTMASKGKDVVVKLGFDETEIDGQTKTMMKFILRLE